LYPEKIIRKLKINMGTIKVFNEKRKSTLVGA
jgi:hypothetical protein